MTMLLLYVNLLVYLAYSLILLICTNYILSVHHHHHTVGCTINSDCLPTEQCLSGKCRNPCHVGRPCPPSFTCTPQNHFPQCTCEIGTANISHRTCDIDHCESSRECPDYLACYQGRCTDLCELVKPCGFGAICEMENHAPICSCDKTMTGDPYVACVEFEKPQCKTDLDCVDNLGCVGGQCKDLCQHMNLCAKNSKCQVNRAGLRKSVYCECISGYSGDPYNECRLDVFNVPKCTNDDSCDNNLKCYEGKCIDPCEMNQACASSGALCRTINHRPICYCPPGYAGDPTVLCVKDECKQDKDCNVDSICLSNRCVDTCSVNNKCTRNAVCHSDNHSSQCVCSPGFSGDPYKACEAVQCIYNEDCASTLICSNNKCVNPCKRNNPCGLAQICDVIDHRILCTCENGFVMSLDNHCENKLGKELSCSLDIDCADETACMTGKCTDMCDDDPCGINAICRMKHKGGDAMVTCTCDNGYVGNPFEECILMPRIPSGCASNEDCFWTEACDNSGRCVNPCSEEGLCGENANCQVQNHRAICSCPLRYSGDPYILCSPGNYYHLLYS